MGTITTRGFRGNGTVQDPRLPPGQYDAQDTWPVLTAEATPDLDVDDWSFTIDGLVQRPTSWTWDEIRSRPSVTVERDIHCVTGWSKLGMSFEGIPVDTLLDQVEPLPTASHVLAVSHTGYTTNLELSDVRDARAYVVWAVDGAPLARDHGGPARLIVPHLYFWKSAKWIAGLQVLDHDEPGFWEHYGYHDRGDPWQEQRYRGD